MRPDPFVYCLWYVRIKMIMLFRLIPHLACLECIAIPPYSLLSARRTTPAGRVKAVMQPTAYFVLEVNDREVEVVVRGSGR